MNSILNLITDLNKLLVKLDRRYDINCGGCCFVAYLVARELEVRNLHDFKLRVYGIYGDECCEEEAKYNITNDLDGAPCRSHTAYHYSIVYNDCWEINKSDADDIEFLDIEGLASEDIKRLYDYGDWNDVYYSNNNIFVERFINIIFKKYDKENKAN